MAPVYEGKDVNATSLFLLDFFAAVEAVLYGFTNGSNLSIRLRGPEVPFCMHQQCDPAVP